VFSLRLSTAKSETILSWETRYQDSYNSTALSLNATVFGHRVNDIQLDGNDVATVSLFSSNKETEAYGMEARRVN
jgi:iron complex outermembrane receptor protein